MKTLKVTVTEDHIARGTKSSMDSCPIALAIAEQTGKTPRVGVLIKLINGETEYYTASIKACNFMDRFDSGRSVKPTKFVFQSRTP